jgi:hypothetical protein
MCVLAAKPGIVERPIARVSALLNLRSRKQNRAQRDLMRGVGAGRSAQRGTSGATTGPRGARSAPPNPDYVAAKLVSAAEEIYGRWAVVVGDV